MQTSPRMTLADAPAMLWGERKLVLAVGGAICLLGAAAALMEPAQGQGFALMTATLPIAALVAAAAGFSRALQRALPALELIEGGARRPPSN